MHYKYLFYANMFFLSELIMSFLCLIELLPNYPFYNVENNIPGSFD